MTETTQASGGGKAVRDDGVGVDDAGGRRGKGESGGGAYKDPEEVPVRPDERGFMGHGGQGDMSYRGAGDRADGDDNPNAVTDEQ